jgi:hypothetical protein
MLVMTLSPEPLLALPAGHSDSAQQPDLVSSLVHRNSQVMTMPTAAITIDNANNRRSTPAAG